jgi:hypothetical protein
MKSKCLLSAIAITVLASVGSIHAQDKIDSKPTIDQNLYKVHFISPGIGYEGKLANNISLNVAASLDPMFYSRKIKLGNGDEKSELSLSGAVTLQAQSRFYYNLQRRLRKNRNISGNSANYFAIAAVGSKDIFNIYDEGRKAGGSLANNPKQKDLHHNVQIEAVWGLQRNYSNFLLNFEAGLSYGLYGMNKKELNPVLNLKLGYLLFR